jgi:hypothetical protein
VAREQRVQPSIRSARIGRAALRTVVSSFILVAGGRFELYSKHLIQIQAVAASIDVPVDLRSNGFLKKVERDGPHYEH